MKLAIIYASKGKATKEIADSLEGYCKECGLKEEGDIYSVNLHLRDEDDIRLVAKAINGVNAIAIGSPTYDNGNLMDELNVFFKCLDEEEITIKGKHVLLFGAYSWGCCESVDKLIEKCEDRKAVVYEHNEEGKNIPNYIGLRMHTREILNDKIIRSYLKGFLTKAGFQNMNLSALNEDLKSEPMEYSNAAEKIESLNRYRKHIAKGQMDGHTFENCQFIRCDFSGQTIEHVVFRDCCFWYSKFDGSTLNDVYFKDCDMTNCSMERTTYIRSWIEGCDMRDSSLKGSDLLFLNLDSVHMENIVLNKDAPNLTERQYDKKRMVEKHEKKRMIEKHEKVGNYHAAASIQSKLYLNAKRVDDRDSAELFYKRMMINRLKLNWKGSLFNRIAIWFLKRICAIARFFKLVKIAEKLEEKKEKHSTQIDPASSWLGCTAKLFLLLVLWLFTGYKNSYIRLIGFTIATILVSSAALTVCNGILSNGTLDPALVVLECTAMLLLLVLLGRYMGYKNGNIGWVCFTIAAILISSVALIACKGIPSPADIKSLCGQGIICIRQSVSYILGIGDSAVPAVGNIQRAVYYVDCFTGIGIKAILGYIIVEKMSR